MKIKRSVIMAIMAMLLMVSMPVYAQQTLSGKAKTSAVARINKVAAGISTMKCGFVQTKTMSMLNDKMVSRGTMYYSRPDRLRWEYTSPYQYIFLLNGSKVYVGNKNKKNVIDTRSNKTFKEIARIMMLTVTGKALGNDADFTSTIVSHGGKWIVKLVPKKKDLRKMFGNVELVFDQKSQMIEKIDILENNKDRTSIVLNNIKTNQNIDAKLFAIP